MVVFLFNVSRRDKLFLADPRESIRVALCCVLFVCFAMVLQKASQNWDRNMTGAFDHCEQ